MKKLLLILASCLCLQIIAMDEKQKDTEEELKERGDK